MRKRELTIPTILGVLLSLVGMSAGLWFLREPIKSAVFASPQEAPAQVQTTNISDSSVVISWLTDKAATGFIQYGQSSNPDLVVSDDRDQERGTVDNYFTHLVTIRGLKPSTTYNFRIGSAKKLYDQQGRPYQVTTGPSLGSPPAADVAYGQVLTGSGEPADGALVYLTLSGTVPQAALVKSSGSWVIPLSTARSADLTSFTAYDPKSSQIQIQVQAGSLGNSTVITTTGQDSPIPTITLGQTYNYTLVANSPVEAASEATSSSRFSSSFAGPATETTSVLAIVSPKTGEQVNSTQPEIIGRGPANSQVTITIQSPTTITGTVQTDAKGEFTYSVPQDLPPGNHTITISALVDGVVKKFRRNFTVLAEGASQIPAFTATPSASIKPSPSPTPTPKPSPTPTLDPRIALPSTESGVPTSGNFTPTLVLLILGCGIIFSGLVVYRKLT